MLLIQGRRDLRVSCTDCGRPWALRARLAAHAPVIQAWRCHRAAVPVIQAQSQAAEMATGATPVASIGVALGASVGNHRYERKPLGQLAQLEVRVPWVAHGRIKLCSKHGRLA